nr:glycosyltransferase [Ralstonia sp. UBA689]
MGRVVVSTDCPTGPREILADGKAGLLTPVGDVRTLADAIRRG